MIEVRFRIEAKADLYHISGYYSDFSQSAAKNVLGDIHDTIETLRLFPKAGRKSGEIKHRRIVTPKYRYVIIYVPSEEVLDIIGIFRFQKR